MFPKLTYLQVSFKNILRRIVSNKKMYCSTLSIRQNIERWSMNLENVIPTVVTPS